VIPISPIFLKPLRISCSATSSFTAANSGALIPKAPGNSVQAPLFTENGMVGPTIAFPNYSVVSKASLCATKLCGPPTPCGPALLYSAIEEAPSSFPVL